MAIPESPISPQLLNGIAQNVRDLRNATQQAAIATLAASIVSARGRATSVAEVMEIQRSLCFAMFPEPGSASWQEWNKNRDEHLAKVYG